MAETELEKKIAEAKQAMFGSLQLAGGKIVLLVSGDARVSSNDPKVEVRRAE